MTQWEVVARRAVCVSSLIVFVVAATAMADGSATFGTESDQYWDTPSQAGTSSGRSYSPTPRRLAAPRMSVRPQERDGVAAGIPAPHAIPAPRPMLAVDVDETLSVTDYNSVLWGIGKDDSKPLPGAQAALNRLAHSFEIIYVTARSRSMKDTTEAWLSRHGFPNGRVVTSPTVGDFIFQGDFKRKVIEKLRRENPNLVVGIGDKVKDGQAYRASRMISVIVNPWRGQKYHADDVVCRDWSAVAEFFQANHEVLSNPRTLNESLSRGRVGLNQLSEAQRSQG